MSLAEPELAAKTIHVEAGQLLFLNTKGRVRRIYVANPAVLDSYTASPQQIVLTAKAPGLSAVVVWDETGREQSYAVCVDLPVAQLRRSMAAGFPTESITVASDGNRVLLSGAVGTRAASDAAEKLAGLFSKEVVNSLVVNSARLRQVKLQVHIVELDRSRLNQLGINIFSPGGGSALGAGTTGQFPSTSTLSSSGTGYTVGNQTLTVSDPLSFLFYSAKANVGVTIRDLENKQIVQILAEPTITTLSGQSASFLAGGEFPFPVVQSSSGGPTSITIQFRPFGVKLDFLPKVNVDGSIELRVMPEVSALDYTNAVSISGYTIPALSTKHAETQVVLRSGQSFAISGLLDRRTTDAYARTPGIASLPIIGALFRSKGVNLSTTELVVIVTPTIVDPLSDESMPAAPQTVRPFLNVPAFDGSLPASSEKP